jgi:ubiquinone/menaquinone biosynthesis C-methylase UbiE
MQNKLATNEEAYKTEEAIDKYSHYYLYPNEKYLVNKYFEKDKVVLDLACGAGRTTVKLFEMGYKIKGIDLSDVLINIAQKRFPYITFKTGSYCHIQEADNSFDNILISHNGLDYAYPESERTKALTECARILKPGGHLIFSSHNIKSLHFSPFYLKQRKIWMLKNTWRAFKHYDYIYDLKMWTFYTSPSHCIKQVKLAGLNFVEMIGFRCSKNIFFNTYFSPYVHYSFKKPDA